MSRFFASVNDSDSESSSEEEAVAEPTTRRRILSYSSDEEQETRLVKSIKHKIIDETNACALSISNFKKINDYNGLLGRFEDLVKIYGKYQKEFKDDAATGEYITCLAELLTYVNSAWEDVSARKLLTKTGFKSLTSLRQKIRKFVKLFEAEIEEYSKNPAKFQGKNDTEKAKHAKKEEEEEDVEGRDRSLSPDWGDSSDSSSSDDDMPYSSLREKFLKKPTQKEDTKVEKKERKKKEAKIDDLNQGEWKTVRGGSVDVAQTPRLFVADSDVTPKSIIDKLNEIVGKRGAKRSERVKQLQDIYEIAMDKDFGPGILVKTKISQVATLFDYNMAKQDCMKLENWTMALRYVEKIGEIISVEDFEMIPDSFDEETLEEAPYRVRLGLTALVERLYEEHKKLLKATNTYTAEYWVRQKDDAKIISIIDTFVEVLAKKSQNEDVCRLKMTKIELLHYKLQKKPEDVEASLKTMDDLCKYVYAHEHGTQRLRTRAILAHIYHLAVHDRWNQASNLMLMSQLQACIEYADIETQVLFNRAMAQLGLCAFRQGHIEDCHSCLMYLVRGMAKTRQLLGQGVSFYRDGNREQEAKERQIQLPAHMHIPVEHIEASFMVSAMLLEVPLLMQLEGEARSRQMSRSFRYLLRFSDRGVERLPPETMTQFVAAACRSLVSFDWRQCRDLIFNPTMDAKVWNGIEQSAHVKDKITRIIQKTTLKLYLKNLASQVYDSISVAHLTELFGMGSEAEMVRVLAGLISGGQLNASISLPQQTLVFQPGSYRSELHKRAYMLTEQCQQLMEQSERVFGMNERGFYRRYPNNRQGIQAN